ncbi:FAD-binding protein [Candidatus Obscuribacterales bacterium]|nr:FAD-binding protein [Candidatus Obscuribacterales bacterium]
MTSSILCRMNQNADLLRKLKTIVGDDYVLTDKEDLIVYECDAETLDTALPDIVVLPATTEQVRDVIVVAREYGISITPRGAGTGLSGGATTISGGISLVLSRMTKILSVDPTDSVAVVQVGATNLSVSQAALPYGLYFAPDPSSQIASTIGGNVAENAGGPHCLKYGMTTAHVLGLKFVMMDGSIVKIGGKTRDLLSLDLLGAIVGSEGTLGVATEATLRLIPRAQAVETMLAYFETVESCGQAVSDIVAEGIIPAAMEMIDNLTLNAVEDYLHMGLNREAAALLIVELDGPEIGIAVHRKICEEVVQKNRSIGLTWATDDVHRTKIWKARKVSFGALGRIRPNGYVLDGVIPRSKLAQAIKQIHEIGLKHQLIVANVYHAGDGNLHPCILYHRDNHEEVNRVVAAGREILELCVELGGTLSGEHGIGVEKMLEMPLVFNEADLLAMRWLKESFDPDELANPAKMIPTPRACGESGRPLSRHQMMSSTC